MEALGRLSFFPVEDLEPKSKPEPPSGAERSVCGTAPYAMVGPIRKTSPSPGTPGPAEAKTIKSIENTIRAKIREIRSRCK